MMAKVLVADDHPIIREGLKQILLSHFDELRVEEACNSHEVIQQVLSTRFEVVILDISMPGRNGLEILEYLKRTRPDIHVLILTMHAEEEYAIRALKSGASGYLTKDSDSEELILALETILQGRKYIRSETVEQLVSELNGSARKAPHEILSVREYQVLQMIAAGKRLTEIAEELSLSLSTVSTHRTRILDKMRMKSNAELIRYAIKTGMVE